MTVSASVQPYVKVLLIPELVHSIARYLRPLERHRARLISQAFQVAFSPYLFLQLNHVFNRISGAQTASISQEQLATVGYFVRKYYTKTMGSTKASDYPFVNPQNIVAVQQCHHVQEVHADWTGGEASHMQGTPDLEAILSRFDQLKILHLQMWRPSCLIDVLPLITSARLAHLESLTLNFHRYYPVQPTSWASIEESLTSCPSLRKLDLTASQIDYWLLRNPAWIGDYGLGPNEIPPFKVFPRIESLILRNSPLTAKGLVFLSHCFPRIESLEIDRCTLNWRDALFDVEYPRPAPVTDQPIPEPDPETRYLTFPDVKRFKWSLETLYVSYRAPWSLRRMIKHMPSLKSLDIDTMHWTVINLREMAEYCSKPEVNQSFERLWINMHMTGRDTYWDLQSVLNLPCFHKLKAFQVAKEAALTKLPPKRQFHFASTLTTLRFGISRMRFEDHILYLINQHLLPNLPNLEVLTLDSMLAGYLLFCGLGFCPEEEERLPKVAMYQRYRKRDGQLVVESASLPVPASTAPVDLVVEQQAENQVVDTQTVIESQDVETQPVIESLDLIESQVVIESQDLEPQDVIESQTVIESQDVESQATIEYQEVEPQIVEHQEVADDGAPGQQEVTHQGTTNSHMDIHDVIVDNQDNINGQEVTNQQEEEDEELRHDVAVDHPGSAPPEVACMTDPVTASEEQTIDQLVMSMAKLARLKHHGRDTIDPATMASERKPYHEYWHPRERPFLRELDITFTSKCRVTMDDIHDKIICRFRHLETLTVGWSKHLDVQEWRDRPEIRNDLRLTGVKVQHRMRGRVMP